VKYFRVLINQFRTIYLGGPFSFELREIEGAKAQIIVVMASNSDVLLRGEQHSTDRIQHHITSIDSVARWVLQPSPNIRLALIFTLIAGVGRGIWSFTVLSGYLYAVTRLNSEVGLAEGIQGVAQLIAAVLAGRYIDQWRRSDWMLQIGSCVGLCAVAALLFTLFSNDSSFAGQRRFALMSAGLGAFGAYQGIWNTALETIFADSVPTGRLRDKVNTQKFVLTLVSTCSGPLLANIYFYTYGIDDWREAALRNVFIIGIALCAPPMLMLCFFRDEDTLGASADAVDMRMPAALVESAVDDSDSLEIVNDKAHNSQKFVLYIVALNDLVGGLGSGMSIKFFPLYFMSRGLSPSNVNWIYITAPIVMALGSKLATRNSKIYGRGRVAMCFGTVGAAGMAGLGVLNLPSRSNTLCIALYFMSCAQHCCRPIKKSLLMDFCARENRGFWNAVDSITRFGWSGSAVLGGYLIDRYDYGATFLATGCMLFAAACLWPLLFSTLDALDNRASAATVAKKQPRALSNEDADNGTYFPLDGDDIGDHAKGALTAEAVVGVKPSRHVAKVNEAETDMLTSVDSSLCSC